MRHMARKTHRRRQVAQLSIRPDGGNARSRARGSGGERYVIVDETGGLEGTGHTDMAARFARLLATQRKRSTVGPLLPIAHRGDARQPRRGSR